MKKYVILSPGINSVGGAQIYIRNKMIYLRENKWDVFIFYYLNHKVYIDDLKEFKDCIHQLSAPPSYYNKQTTKKIINTICERIGYGDDIIIESHTICTALWGELIAQELNAKHLVFLLQEIFPRCNIEVFRFLDYKHKRKELVGINKESLRHLFLGYKSVADEEAYSLVAACNNSVEYVNSYENFIDEASDVNIVCIGRCDKNYVLKCVCETNKFCEIYPQKRVNLIIAGGCKDNNVLENLAMCAKADNLNLSITGYIFPIPQQLLEQATFVVAGAGSARCAAAIPVLTISMDVEGSPIGMFGIDTKSTIYSDNNNDKSLIDYYCKIIDGVYKISDISSEVINESRGFQEFRTHFNNHMEFLAHTSDLKEFYDTNNIYLNKMNKLLFRILGSDLYVRIQSLIKKTRKM